MNIVSSPEWNPSPHSRVAREVTPLPQIRESQTEGPQKHYPSATWAGLLLISTGLNEQQEGCLGLAYVCCFKTKVKSGFRSLRSNQFNNELGQLDRQYFYPIPRLFCPGEIFSKLKMG